jgi:FlaA1/EpsC-like NDP-sugar epimerase
MNISGRSFVFKKTVFKRRAFFLACDILLITAAMFTSFWARFNGDIPENYENIMPYYIGLALVIKLFYLAAFNLYDISWRYVGLEELVKAFKAVSLGSLTLGMIMFLLRTVNPFSGSLFPRSVLILDFMFSLFFIGSLRASKRLFLEGLKSTLKYEKNKKRLLIMGAGDAGEQIVREISRKKNSRYFPIGFVDDDKAKQGIHIHGVKVLGGRKDIPRLIQNENVEEVLIALPSAHSKEIKEIVELIRNTISVQSIKILPGIYDLMDNKVTLSDIKKVRLEDLLGRDPVRVDMSAIKKCIEGKRILVTGAAGSIGSELSRSILRFNPESLIALDIDETEAYLLMNKLKVLHSSIIPVIGDVRDKTKLDSIIKKYNLGVIFHSAAYKHVPIQEYYPEEAVKTNIMGTKVLAELAVQYGVEKFVNISTDKAINPTSVMGATKRVGEQLLKVYNTKNKTQFISVRFGNVLGSRGSVIPLFKEQIERGGPVTVTHPEMKRYFMVTSEAVLLVLEASALGQGGEIFVLDMGEPVKIIDLAKEMIRLSGYETDKDIPIVYTQMRPGEKLFEELLSAEEGVERTKYKKIYKAKSQNEINTEKITSKVDQIINLGNGKGDREEIIGFLKELVPNYQSSNKKYVKIFW